MFLSCKFVFTVQFLHIFCFYIPFDFHFAAGTPEYP